MPEVNPELLRAIEQGVRSPKEFSAPRALPSNYPVVPTLDKLRKLTLVPNLLPPNPLQPPAVPIDLPGQPVKGVVNQVVKESKQLVSEIKQVASGSVSRSTATITQNVASSPISKASGQIANGIGSLGRSPLGKLGGKALGGLGIGLGLIDLAKDVKRTAGDIIDYPDYLERMGKPRGSSTAGERISSGTRNQLENPNPRSEGASVPGTGPGQTAGAIYTVRFEVRYGEGTPQDSGWGPRQAVGRGPYGGLTVVAGVGLIVLLRNLAQTEYGLLVDSGEFVASQFQFRNIEVIQEDGTPDPTPPVQGPSDYPAQSPSGQNQNYPSAENVPGQIPTGQGQNSPLTQKNAGKNPISNSSGAGKSPGLQNPQKLPLPGDGIPKVENLPKFGPLAPIPLLLPFTRNSSLPGLPSVGTTNQTGTFTKTETPSKPTPTPDASCGGCSRDLQLGQQANSGKLDKLLQAGTVGGELINLAVLNTINNKLGPQLGNGGISGFLQRFSKSLHLDKVLGVMNTALLLHNAAMLSSNLAYTLGDVASTALNLVVPKDADDAAIDVNEVLGREISNFFKGVLGEAVYNQALTEWHKANRIVQTGTNILYSVRSIMDSAQQVAEWTAENTGRIGNALKRFRLVGENAYKWMPERVNAQTAAQQKVNRMRDGIDSLDESASSLQGVLSEVQGITSEINELRESKQQFETLITTGPAKVQPENTPIKTAADASNVVSASPAIADPDRSKAEP